MLMRRRGVHSGLVVKVNLKLYVPFDLKLHMYFHFLMAFTERKYCKKKHGQRELSVILIVDITVG